MRKSFASYAEASGSDKYSHHAYHRFYPLHLDRLSSSDGNMLEIGINTGSSLKLWQEYFPYAYIHGADIGFAEQGERYTVHKIDQSNPIDLQRLIEEVGKAFFIIDDGSHIPDHQVLALDTLLG